VKNKYFSLIGIQLKNLSSQLTVKTI